MKKDEISKKLRQYARSHVSLGEDDRRFVNVVYDAFRKLFNNTCIQIGSYPRFTAVRPIHDLDILYLLGPWNENQHEPSEILEKLSRQIKESYENPTKCELEVSLQTHSITVSFFNSGEEVFAVDIVPAYSARINEFGQDMYMVPELIRNKRGENRKKYYESLKGSMKWITSDPRGYIEVAKRVNEANSDYRRTVKLVKAWKNGCKKLNDEFPLKSFYLEQLITIFFRKRMGADIFDSVFEFFHILPKKILSPTIKDRADSSKYIDAYISDLTDEQREMVYQARDHFLKNLEEIKDSDPIDLLFNVQFYQRACASEEYLFDQGIPVLTELDYSFKIIGDVQQRKGGFRRYILDVIGFIPIDRKIYFRIKGTPPPVDIFKWKVKNDDSAPEPRGEITDHQTKNDPENTKYRGNHYVECYAILNKVCVAKARQNVKLGV